MAISTNWCRDLWRASVHHKSTIDIRKYDDGSSRIVLVKGDERVGRVTILNGESMTIDFSQEETKKIVESLYNDNEKTSEGTKIPSEYRNETDEVLKEENDGREADGTPNRRRISDGSSDTNVEDDLSDVCRLGTDKCSNDNTDTVLSRTDLGDAEVADAPPEKNAPICTSNKTFLFPPSDAPSDEPVTPPDWRGESVHNQWDASPDCEHIAEITETDVHCRTCGEVLYDAPTDEVMRVSHLLPESPVETELVDATNAHADAIERLDNASAREAKRWRLKYNDLQQQIAKLEHRLSEKGEE